MNLDTILDLLLKDPDASKVIVSSAIERYKPLLYSICGELFGIYKDLVNNDEYYNTMALYDKKKLDALVNVGFSRDEAMDIIIVEKRNLQAQTKGLNVPENRRNA